MDKETADLTVFISRKSLDTAQGTFSGLGSTFGNEDYNGDIVEAGAYTRTLSEHEAIKARTKSRYVLPLLWMHDEKQPCGGIIEARETKEGLLIDGVCDLNTELGRMVFSGMQQGYISQFSIGYNTIKSTRDQKGVRHLLDIRLWEISAITQGYAANPEASVYADSVKSRTNGGTNMNRKGFSTQRPILSGNGRAPVAHIPPKPGSEDDTTTYASDAEFNAAWFAWQRKYNGMPAAAAAQSAWSAETDVILHKRRLFMSQAERWAEYKRTGRTPDGRTISPDVDTAIERAHAALETKRRVAADEEREHARRYGG